MLPVRGLWGSSLARPCSAPTDCTLTPSATCVWHTIGDSQRIVPGWGGQATAGSIWNASNRCVPPRTDTFFQAIPLGLEQHPKTTFLCPAMAGEAEAERWSSAIQADERVVLLPNLSQGQLWALFTRCPVSTSIPNHAGPQNP